MVTRKSNTPRYLDGFDIRGLSTDTKPTVDVPNGGVFIDIDTGKGYLFDAAGGEWHEVPAGSSVVINPAAGVSF